jgi:glycosyltransferase involved in cell wall biosynthesis
MSDSVELVSIVTCTYNRKIFYENLKHIVADQNYPHDLLEWVIVDDSTESNAEMFPAVLDSISIRYFHLKNKIPLGKKRDFINRLAKGKYIVNFDDDDYYPPCRVSHAVDMLKKTNLSIAGCNIMFMYFCKNKQIYQLGPYGDNHATAATFAYTKEYTKTHTFFDPANGHYGEESVFTNNWQTPMAQLDPMKTTLTLSHTDNTIEKTMFLEEKYGQLNKTVRLTGLKISDFMGEDYQQFYLNIPYEFKVNDISKEVRKMLEKNVAVTTQHATQPAGNQTQIIQRMATELHFMANWKHKLQSFGLPVNPS